MDSNAVTPLVFPSDCPADIMIRVSNVAAFLETTLSGEHVKMNGTMTLHSDAMEGLAHIIGFIHTAAHHASVTCKD